VAFTSSDPGQTKTVRSPVARSCFYERVGSRFLAAPSAPSAVVPRLGMAEALLRIGDMQVQSREDSVRSPTGHSTSPRTTTVA
jgi:hypothetical protein